MATNPAAERAKTLKSIGSYGASAKAANVTLPDRLQGYLDSGKQTAVEQTANAGGAVLKALNIANRPSQAILQTLQSITGNNTDNISPLQALKDTSGKSDINLRAALGKDPNSGGRALGLIDTIGTAALDPLSFVGGTGALAKAGRLVGKDVLAKDAAQKLSEKGLNALSKTEHAQLSEGLLQHGGGSQKYVDKTLKALQKPEGVTFAGSGTLIPTGKVSRVAKEAFNSTKIGSAITNKANKIADVVSPSGVLRRAGVLAKEGVSRGSRVARAEANLLRTETEAKFAKALRGGSISEADKEIINGALHTGQITPAINQLEQAGSTHAAETLRTIGDLRPALSAKQLEIGSVKAGTLQDTATFDPRVATPEAKKFFQENPEVAQNVFGGQYENPNLLKTKGISFRTFMPGASIKEANNAFEAAHGIRPFEEDPVKRWLSKTEQVARDVENASFINGLKGVRTGGQGKGGQQLLVDGFDQAGSKAAKGAHDVATKLLVADTKKWTRRKAVNDAALKTVQKTIKELEKIRADLVKEGFGNAFKRDAAKITKVRQGKIGGGESLTGKSLLAGKKAKEVARRLETLKKEESRYKDRAFNIDREKPGPENVNWRKGQIQAEKDAKGAFEKDLASKGYVKINAGSLGEKWVLKDTAKFLKEYAEATAPENLGAATKFMQQWTQLWKGYATVPVLFGAGFHTRNAVGNVWNMWLHGFRDPRYFSDATNAAAAIRLNLRKGVPIHTAIDGTNLKPATKEALHEAVKEGIIDSSYFHSDFAKHAPETSAIARAKTKANPLSTNNALIKPGRAIGSLIEDTSRLAMFLSEYEKHGSAAQAARRTKEALFDYCVDQETQALTSNGWKYVDEISENDLFLTLNPKTNEILWLPGTINVFPAQSREMIRIKNTRFDALVTKEHRWLAVGSGILGGYWRGEHGQLRQVKTHFVETKEIKNKRIITNGGGYAQSIEQIYPDWLVELAGWFITEGTVHKTSGALTISQSLKHNPAYVTRIRNLVDECSQEGYKISEYQRDIGWGTIITWYFPRDIATRIFDMCEGKNLPPQLITNLTKNQAKSLLKTLIDADGTRTNKGTEVFSQQSIDRMNGFQMLAAMLGIRTTLHSAPNILCATLIKARTSYLGRSSTIETYTGQVWCPTVPTGVWMMRRNGMTSWTGNSDLSKTDRDIKKFVPFATFASRNIPAQIRGALEHPGRALLPAKVQAQQNATGKTDTSILPQYALLGGQQKIGSSNGNTLLGNVQLPQAAAIQQLSPLTSLLGARPDEGRLRASGAALGQNFGGGPLGLFRALTENAAGASSFSGAPITTEADAARNLATALNPLFGKGYTSIARIQDPNRRAEAILSALGVSTTTVTPQKQNAELYRRANVLRTYNKQHGVASQTTSGHKSKTKFGSPKTKLTKSHSKFPKP